MKESKVVCPECGQSRYRRARFRISDIPYAILMHLPLRCGNCAARFRVWSLTALQIGHAQKTRAFQVRMEAERLSKQEAAVAAAEAPTHVS